jgi:hypothetical protein
VLWGVRTIAPDLFFEAMELPHMNSVNVHDVVAARWIRSEVNPLRTTVYLSIFGAHFYGATSIADGPGPTERRDWMRAMPWPRRQSSAARNRG